MTHLEMLERMDPGTFLKVWLVGGAGLQPIEGALVKGDDRVVISDALVLVRDKDGLQYMYIPHSSILAWEW